ncbi:MAG: endosialidase [Acetivibrio sp.]
MPIVKGLIRKEDNNTLSFGDYTLDTKTKICDFEFKGDLYKIKTFHEITKLKKNGILVYESMPGTAVNEFCATSEEVSFKVEGPEDAQITLELEPEQVYKINMGEECIGEVKTNLGGKLALSVPLENGEVVCVKVVKMA